MAKYNSKSGQLFEQNLAPIDAIIGPWNSINEFENWVTSTLDVDITSLPKGTHIRVIENNVDVSNDNTVQTDVVVDYYWINNQWTNSNLLIAPVINRINSDILRLEQGANNADFNANNAITKADTAITKADAAANAVEQLTGLEGSNFLGVFSNLQDANTALLSSGHDVGWCLFGTDLTALTAFKLGKVGDVPKEPEQIGSGTYDFTDFSDVKNNVKTLTDKVNGVEENVVTTIDFTSGTLLNYNINTSSQAWTLSGTSRYFSIGDNKYIHVKANSRGTVISFMRKAPTNSPIDATELENDYIVKTDSGKKYLTYGAGTESTKLKIPAGTLYVVLRASNTSGDQIPEIFEMYKIDKTHGIEDDIEDIKNDITVLENEVFGMRKEVAYTHGTLTKISQVYIASGDTTIIAQSAHETYTVYYHKLKAGTAVRIERNSGDFTIKRGYALEEPTIGVFVNDVEVYADTESRYDYVMPVDGYFIMYVNAIDANINNWTLYVTESTSSIKHIETILGDKINEPKQEGAPGQVLTTDGRGGRRWSSVAGTASGGSSIRSLEDYSAWRKATWANMASANKNHPINFGEATVKLNDTHGTNNVPNTDIVVRAPQTVEEMNLMKKCLQMINLSWTAKGAIAGKQWDYVSGTAYKSLPYSSNGCKLVGTGISIETFYTAVMNKYSLMYTECCYDGHIWKDKVRPSSIWNEKQVSTNKYLENSNAFAYYGTVCCGMTSAVVGCNAKIPNQEHHLFSEYQGIIAKIYPDSVKLDENPIEAFPYLEVGDILNDREHSLVVIGVIKGTNGLTEKVLLAESTSANSTNGCHFYKQGDNILWTKDALNDYLISNYDAISNKKEYRKFYRPVSFYQNVKYDPCTDYVAVTDFGETKTTKTESSVMTFAGNKVTFRNNDLVVINYNIFDNASYAYTYLHVARKKTNSNDAWVSVKTKAISAIDNSVLPQSQRNHAWRLSDEVTLEDGYEYRVWADSESANSAEKPTSSTGYTYFDVVDGTESAVEVSVGDYTNERRVKYKGSGKITYLQINTIQSKLQYTSASTTREVNYFTRGCSVFPLPSEVANNEVTLLPKEQFALMGYAYSCSHVRVIVRGKYGQVDCNCVSLGLDNDEGGGDDTDPDADSPVSPNPPQESIPGEVTKLSVKRDDFVTDGNGTLNICLEEAPSSPKLITLSSDDDTTLSKSSIRFDVSNWNVYQSVDVNMSTEGLHDIEISCDNKSIVSRMVKKRTFGEIPAKCLDRLYNTSTSDNGKWQGVKQAVNAAKVSFSKSDLISTAIIITDTHWGHNNKFSPDVVNWIRNNIDDTQLFFLGDCIYDKKVTQSAGLKEMDDFIKAFDYNMISTPGNHDWNGDGTDTGLLSDDQVFEHLLCYNEESNPNYVDYYKKFKNVDEFANLCSGGYLDDTKAQIRYILFNFSVYPNSLLHEGNGITTSYTRGRIMLKNMLEDMPEGYKAIALTHGVSNKVNDTYNIPLILNAAPLTTCNRITDLIAVFCGHNHAQHYFDKETNSSNFTIKNHFTNVMTLSCDMTSDSKFGNLAAEDDSRVYYIITNVTKGKIYVFANVSRSGDLVLDI